MALNLIEGQICPTIEVHLKDLDGNGAIERFLDRFVDDPHPPTANLTYDLQVAQAFDFNGIKVCRSRPRPVLVLQLLQSENGEQQLAELGGTVPMPSHVVFDGWRVAFP